MANLPGHQRKHDLIGRGADLALLERLIGGGAPLITLMGPAGIGKTLLAACFAAKHRSRVAAAGGRVWFCDLAETVDARGITSAVARELGVPLVDVKSGPAAIERLGHALAAQPALLVLDNLEQVLDAGRAIVSDWLD